MSKIIIIGLLVCAAFFVALASMHFLSFFPWFNVETGFSLPLAVSIWLCPVLTQKNVTIFALGAAGISDALAFHAFPALLVATAAACAATLWIPFEAHEREARYPQLVHIFSFAVIAAAVYVLAIAIIHAVARDIFFDAAFSKRLAIAALAQFLIGSGGAGIAWSVRPRVKKYV